MKHSNKKAWEKTFDAIDDWICIIDLDSKIYRSNLTAEKLFGMKIQEVIGKKCCSLAHGIEKPVHKCPLPKMIQTRKRESSELQIKNGRWIFVTVDPLFNNDAEMIGAVHIARDITERIKYQNERERIFKELEDALAQVKRLSGLIPICGHCKKIRDDQGYWNRLESYIEKHSDASFSHGMCPECSEKLYCEEDWYIEMKRKKKK